MKVKYIDKNGSFLDVAKTYLHSDCVSLYQVLVQFFKGLNDHFKLYPISNLSIPGVAFKAWKQHQLPHLNTLGLHVHDLSKTLDPFFREGYHGGIVDVYKPYMAGEGYYYDVNSLYPTPMSLPMPGAPYPGYLTYRPILQFLRVS
jgi:hypothetical protein